MVMLDDDAVDAGVQDDMDQEMWQDVGQKTAKRQKQSDELKRYLHFQHQRTQQAGGDSTEDEDDSTDDEDEDADACGEDEEAEELATRQSKQRTRRRAEGTRIIDSDSD